MFHRYHQAMLNVSKTQLFCGVTSFPMKCITLSQQSLKADTAVMLKLVASVEETT